MSKKKAWARLTSAWPDRNRTWPVPADFFSVLQSGFLAHDCSMPAWLHQNFEGNLKEHLFGLKKDWKQGKSRSKSGSTKKFLQVSFKLLVPCLQFFFAVSNLVQSSRYQAGVIWLQSSQSIKDHKKDQVWFYFVQPFAGLSPHNRLLS